MGPVEEFAPLLRQDAIRQGLALATFVVLLIDGAEGLANMGRLCFPTALQIVDFYHAMAALAGVARTKVRRKQSRTR